MSEEQAVEDMPPGGSPYESENEEEGLAAPSMAHPAPRSEADIMRPKKGFPIPIPIILYARTEATDGSAFDLGEMTSEDDEEGDEEGSEAEYDPDDESTDIDDTGPRPALSFEEFYEKIGRERMREESQDMEDSNGGDCRCGVLHRQKKVDSTTPPSSPESTDAYDRPIKLGPPPFRINKAVRAQMRAQKRAEEKREKAAHGVDSSSDSSTPQVPVRAKSKKQAAAAMTQKAFEDVPKLPIYYQFLMKSANSSDDSPMSSPAASTESTTLEESFNSDMSDDPDWSPTGSALESDMSASPIKRAKLSSTKQVKRAKKGPMRPRNPKSTNGKPRE